MLPGLSRDNGSLTWVSEMCGYPCSVLLPCRYSLAIHRVLASSSPYSSTHMCLFLFSFSRLWRFVSKETAPSPASRTNSVPSTAPHSSSPSPTPAAGQVPAGHDSSQASKTSVRVHQPPGGHSTSK